MLYGYARVVSATAEIVTVGSYRWPDLPKGSVLVIWHGNAPSLLVAFTARRPSMPVKLMVSRDPRGDCVALFCNWLGFEIVRGDAEHGGWKALIEIANEVHNGAVALISPDGGGPPFIARVGAAALASAADVPLIPVGADCRPSVFDRHKWDNARNPLPYGRIAVACGEPLMFPPFEDAASLEGARRQLQDALDRAAGEARRRTWLYDNEFRAVTTGLITMLNEEIARIFERMARVLAFKDKDRFRIMAYERAALSIRDLEDDVASIAAEGKLEDIPGIGKDLSAMIDEYVHTRKMKRYDQECRGIPEGLIDLMSIPGLGPKTLALLHRKFRVRGLEDLKSSLEKAASVKLKGFGPKKIDNIKRGIDLWLASQKRMLIGVALPLAENLLSELRKIKLIEHADVAGSLRRRRETIGDLDVLIMSKDSPRALQQVVKLPMVRQVLGVGDTKATVIIEGGIQVDIRSVARESYGAALQYFRHRCPATVHGLPLHRARPLARRVPPRPLRRAARRRADGRGLRPRHVP